MFSGTSHSYDLEVVALWASFVPAFTVGLVIAGAQFERLRRAPKPLRVKSLRSATIEG